MASLTCPNCGKDNPDFFDDCQFCQTPLRREATLNIGENPTKKSTGELEPILPDWLRDARQQARESAEEEASKEATKPKIQKEEPVDLLAGLAFQAAPDEEEVPDWLSAINPVVDKKATTPSKPAEEEPSDFFAQFNQPAKEPSQPASTEMPQAESSAWMSGFEGETQQNEPVDWLSQPAESISPEPSAPEQPEDLSWLRDLEASTKQPSTPAAPQADMGWMQNLDSTSGAQEDLSWLNNLGGTPAPESQAASQEDLGWLNNLGESPAPAQPESSQEDLGWLSKLGEEPAPAAPVQPEAQPEDLSWLNNLGGISTPPQTEAPSPFAQTEEPDWLKSSGQQEAATPETPLSPPHTAPLSEDAVQSMPDWLKSAVETPSMPPLGAASKDWFAAQKQPAEETEQTPPSRFQKSDLDRTQPEPATADQNLFAPAGESSSLSNKDVDALFNVDMPDWLSQPEPPSTEPSAGQGEAIPAASGDELAPVDLPSWVQAMRPVESVISEASAVTADQTTEREGPLAGFRGVIPFIPIGSSQRPKAISLKLQATDEQQAGAALLEQIIASETTAHPLKSSSLVASQRTLRWVLTGLFIVVLMMVLGFGTQFMPVSNLLPVEVNNAVNVVTTMPENAPVLVVMDYEPALAGEMEAAAGPLLDQMAALRKSNYTFVSTSPNGSALVERLLQNTKINQPAPDGLDYQLDQQYFNLGYLSGGSAGVRGFIENPKVVIPAVSVNLFSDFAAVLIITDHAESSQVWIEQLALAKQGDPTLATRPLLVVASAQAGPMLQPYVASQQVAGMISGISNAARYEFVNGSRPGIVRSYWDAFGVGLFLAIVSIFLGSVWSLISGVRARRAEAEQE